MRGILREWWTGTLGDGGLLTDKNETEPGGTLAKALTRIAQILITVIDSIQSVALNQMTTFCKYALSRYANPKLQENLMYSMDIAVIGQVNPF